MGDIVSIWSIWFDKDILSGWCGDYLLTYNLCSLATIFKMKRWISDPIVLEGIEEAYDVYFDEGFGHYYETPDGKKI